MEKVIKERKVAVLVSPNYGAGWYSWNSGYKELLFHPKLVEMVEQGKRDEITKKWIKDNLNINMQPLGAEDLIIEWLPVGTQFMIYEYDGYESLCTLSDLKLITA